MFWNLAANAVQGVFLNLARIADLDQYIAKVEPGKSKQRPKKRRGIPAIVEHSSGRKQVHEDSSKIDVLPVLKCG